MILSRRLIPALGLLLTVMAAPVAMAQQPPPPVTAADRILGRADAPVTVIEYSSFICPHCARWHLEVLPAFKARFIDTGQVRLVYRDVPTDPIQLSATAAGVGRCAAPERFFDVAQALMQGQAALRAGGEASAWFRPALEASGRSVEELSACLEGPEPMAAVQADMAGAAEAGVMGTPSFFVNGQAVADGQIETLAAAIEPLLAKD
ncbi:MAG TPA: DsbA family protein [Brevundimonas sp.]|uniref:DsbA family protein n=1 Tax=Brevundimonas sp. TaxID=1871086 RepID=UPI00261067CB|nr:DsbA family protein [Brevundimonas sp.]HRO33404.1 DsbA family protein [Brevundimonas sp.]